MSKWSEFWHHDGGHATATDCYQIFWTWHPNRSAFVIHYLGESNYMQPTVRSEYFWLFHRSTTNFYHWTCQNGFNFVINPPNFPQIRRLSQNESERDQNEENSYFEEPLDTDLDSLLKEVPNSLEDESAPPRNTEDFTAISSSNSISSAEISENLKCTPPGVRGITLA